MFICIVPSLFNLVFTMGGMWSVSSTPSNRLSDFGNWIVGEQYFGKINEVFQSGDDILPIYSRQGAESIPPPQ
jgi:hypothetical protein